VRDAARTSADPRERIAIVGSGIAGLTCVHVLGPRHDVVLFEADDRLGGHTNTVDVEDPEAGTLPVDTGFIVHNDRTYPNLVKMFDQLGVDTVDTTMSFAVTDRDPSSATCGLTYRASSPNTLFADRRNLARPAMWRMVRDIARFYAAANEFLSDPDDATTLDTFVTAGRYSRDFVDLHLIPLGSAVWSADPSTFGDFPARSLLSFLANHGLLSVGDRPQWRAVRGGSRTYVDAIASRFPGSIRLRSPVERVWSGEEGVIVQTATQRECFDRVILAVHADQALRMLTDATSAEREVLGAVRFQPNRATLHTDIDLLSPRRRAWAAWNYDRRGSAARATTVTYDLTNLQHLPGCRRYLVSLNSDEWIAPRSMIASFDYAHPVFDLAAIAAQQRFAEIDGARGVHYCGAWWGHGFHEDGVVSALRVCDRIGATWSPHRPVALR
jgi:predicted NAD/FAD-binding protein